jgi:hypothetical protein
MARSPQFEWQVVEQEEAWAALSAAASTESAAQRVCWRAPWVWALVGLLGLVTGGGVYALERTAEAGWEVIEAELQAAVAADAWTTEQRPAAQAPAVQMMQAEVHGSQAVVQAVVTQTLASGEQVAYLTTDFYTASDAGWVRTAPGADQLGPPQTLATQYLTIRYYAVDEPVVRAIAPRLDTLYAQACANFGLAPETLAHALTVELVMDPHRAAGWVWRSSGEAIKVASPVLLQLPAEQPPAEWIYQSVAGPLVEAVLGHAEPQTRGWVSARDFRWYPMLQALQLWQLWQADGALAKQRTEVLRQFYGAPPASAAFAACRAHPVWQLSLPLVVRLCRELVGAERVVQISGTHTPPPRRLLDIFLMADNGYDSVVQWGETAALETLVEYAVARYGVERLPMLVRATGDYTTWAGLIDAVYGVSAEEFEQGWQAYVAEHYAAQPGR